MQPLQYACEVAESHEPAKIHNAPVDTLAATELLDRDVAIQRHVHAQQFPEEHAVRCAEAGDRSAWTQTEDSERTSETPLDLT